MHFRHQIIALLVNVLIVFQPIIPLLEFQVFNDYIVNQLCENKDVPDSCCQGKCYLEKRLNEAGSTSNSENEDRVPEKRFRQFESNLPKEILSTRCFFMLSLAYAEISVQYTFQNYKEIFHPPCM
ncbi:MAG: hypothetical protein ACERKD_01060 [Prolixibacteraceae bacterium]